jgi:hypothetical protein
MLEKFNEIKCISDIRDSFPLEGIIVTPTPFKVLIRKELVLG